MAIVTFVCLISPMTISIRHFTVPLALLSLLLAPVPRLLENLRDAGRPWARPAVWVAAALAAASVVTVVDVYKRQVLTLEKSLGISHLEYSRRLVSSFFLKLAPPQIGVFWM